MFFRIILLISLSLLFNFIGCKENSVEPNDSEIKITKITNLSNFGVYTAKLTPNKSKVLYSFSEDYGMNYEIRICDINGSNDKQIVKMGHIQYFAISKDETKFAFLSSPDGAIDALYLLDIPSNQITKLAEEETSVDTSYFPVAFSLDNSKILVNAYYYINSVYLFDISSKTVINLTGDVNSYPITFTPSGNEILYNTFDKLCLVNIDGSDNRIILEGFFDYNCIGFTSDGNSIIFSARKSGEVSKNIYKLSKDGSNLVAITSDSSISYANDISLDGNSILYTSNKKTNNLRMDVFLNISGNDKVLVDGEYDDMGIGFTNIPNKLLVTRTNSSTDPNNIYLVEY